MTSHRGRARAPAPPLQRLGQLSVGQFLARHWQRNPGLFRQAIPDQAPPLSRDQLLALAAADEVESRLVSRTGSRWSLAHGPFGDGELPLRRRRDWTLLVQGADLHDAACARMAARFRFVPAARFDDVMVSYAVDGGGVGPHVDDYDVFLWQAQGRRRWRIARHFDPRLVPGLPVRILANFEAEQEWLLEPGDLLYLPPGVAHDGVAEGECITVSVGFRAPTWQEVGETWSYEQAERTPLAGRYRDPGLRPTRRPGRLPAAMTEAALRELSRRRPRRADVQLALLANLTEPKQQVVFDPPSPALTLARFTAAVRRAGLAADARSRLLYAGATVAINGEVGGLEGATLRLFQALADQLQLTPTQLREAPGDSLAPLHGWYLSGWLRVGGQT